MWRRWRNANSHPLGILNRGWNLKIMTPKSMFWVENYIFFWLKRGRQSQIYNVAHAVVSVPGVFLFGFNKFQCPSDHFLIFHHNEFQQIQAKSSAGPWVLLPLGWHLPVWQVSKAALSNSENRCCAIWIGLAVVKAFIWKSKHAENSYSGSLTG